MTCVFLEVSRASLGGLRPSGSVMFVLIIHNIATCSNNEKHFNRFHYNPVAHETLMRDVCIASCLRRLYNYYNVLSKCALRQTTKNPSTKNAFVFVKYTRNIWLASNQLFKITKTVYGQRLNPTKQVCSGAIWNVDNNVKSACPRSM